LIDYSLSAKTTNPTFFKNNQQDTVRQASCKQLETRRLALNNLPCHSNASIIQLRCKAHFRTSSCKPILFSLFCCPLMRCIRLCWTS